MKRVIRCGGKPMTAIVLAGGRGRRMKADKAGLRVGERTLLEHVIAQIESLFDEIIVSVSKGQGIGRRRTGGGTPGTGQTRPLQVGSSGVRLAEDEVRDQGPIGGILAGLRAARHEACAVVACDIPDVDIVLLRSLARAAGAVDIAVPVGPSGFYEPLFAVYRKTVIPEIESLLNKGERSILPLFERCPTAMVRFKDFGLLRNLNTRGDYEAYLRTVEGRPAVQAEGGTGRMERGRSREKIRGAQSPGRATRP